MCDTHVLPPPVRILARQSAEEPWQTVVVHAARNSDQAARVLTPNIINSRNTSQLSTKQ